MKTRIISALVMLPLLGIVYLGGIYLEVAAILVTFIGLKEIYEAFEAAGFKPWKILGYLSVPSIYLVDRAIGGAAAFTPWIMTLMFGCMIYGFRLDTVKIKDMAVTLFGAVYVVLSFFFVVLIDRSGSFSSYIWLVFIISLGTDTLAYFTGMLIGKHKLCPDLSPKKTIEGAVGGVIGAVVLASLFEAFVVKGGNALSFNFIVMAIIGSVVSQLGDLSASSIKRRTGIKDYGNLIPGHGGIMDRFDSVLFVAPYLYIYITYILPFM